MTLLSAACSHDITRLTHDCADRPGGWCPPAQAVASAGWEYAQLAHNAYWQTAEDSDNPRDRLFVLAPKVKERFASADDARGYAFSVFDRFAVDNAGQERLVETVLAYRGTEGPKDWWHGNLLGRQDARGMITYRQLRAGMDGAGYAEVPITIVGHSLGGRIAVSVVEELAEQPEGLRPDLALWLFNSTVLSPLLAPVLQEDSNRVAISERGEIAGAMRRLDRGSDWAGYVIDCRPGFYPIASHYPRPLAACLTWVAAREDARAARSVKSNEIVAPAAEAR